jgi:hypothetical protein
MRKEDVMMRKLLIAAAAAGTLVAAVPVSAQVYLGADPGVRAFKLARSGLAWGRATDGVATIIMRMAQIVPSSGSVS